MIGKIKKVKLGIVTFDPDDAPDITVQLRKLKTIGGGNRVYRIETALHNLYFGTILPHPRINTIYIKTDSDTVTLDLELISVLNPLEKEFVQRFSGTVGLGYTYTRSSGFGRLNYDVSVKYISRKTEFTVTTSGIYTLYDSLFSRDKEDIYIKYNYYFLRNWFSTVFVAYQRNLELSLERRFQEGFGIGNKFLTTKHAYTFGRGGLVFNQERSTEDVNSGTLTEIFGQVEVNLFRFEKPEVNILFAQTFYYSLSQSGRFKNDGSTSVTWEIFKDFNLSFEPYNNYDSKPPVEGSDKFDFGVAFGNKYKFLQTKICAKGLSFALRVNNRVSASSPFRFTNLQLSILALPASIGC